MTIVSSFHEARGGAGDEDDALQIALEAFARDGRAAWPGVPLEDELLGRYLGGRAPADRAPAAWLGELRAGDLYLACACAQARPEALRAFDQAFLQHLEGYLCSLRPTPEIVAETRQELLEKLFVGVRGGPPKITQYEGRGALGGWVRVAAVRIALNLLEAEKAARDRPDDAGDLARALVPQADPEIALIRASYEGDFLAAFRAAMAGLARRDRTLLRFVFCEQLGPAQIGAMYGVHRSTALRWIAAAEDEILARTRALMIERHRLSASECDQVFALLKSRIDISLSAILKTDP